MKIRFLSLFVLIVLMVTVSFSTSPQNKIGNLLLKMSLQKRTPSEMDEGAFIIANDIQQWDAGETAIIICDMWDKHWCRGATARVLEMAPFMNNVVSIAREKGVTIVHAPSGCMDYYKDHPARKLGKRYKDRKAASVISNSKLASEENVLWPIDQSDGGCDCTPECTQGSPWTHQTDLISIYDDDAISDSGVEISGLFRKRGIKNVILMGVHTNMCVIGRSFGLRNMVRLGYNVVLMRDMTDTMYDSKQWPRVSHFTGNSLIAEYIERYVCPTIVSSVFTGKKQFRFKDDDRFVVAFITAEGEYRTNQRFPEFAHNFLLKRDINCEYAVGKPVMEGEGRHNIENLQILNDADMVVIAVRRRALEPEKMKLVKEYINNGNPLLGIRTASHAFDAKRNVPREGGGLVSASEQAGEFLDQWPEFDKEVLGGNYQGHYGHLEEGTKITITPGMEGHPLLKGIDPEGFTSPSWLYKNRPLRSQNIQVLLTGTIPGQHPEPVMWINNREKGKVVYTSLGHWDDWENENFNTLIFNSVNYLLGNLKIKSKH
jgi:nicotinamidase-related amidase/type 1 glutamine amidotransferase